MNKMIRIFLAGILLAGSAMALSAPARAQQDLMAMLEEHAPAYKPLVIALQLVKQGALDQAEPILIELMEGRNTAQTSLDPVTDAQGRAYSKMMALGGLVEVSYNRGNYDQAISYYNSYSEMRSKMIPAQGQQGVFFQFLDHAVIANMLLRQGYIGSAVDRNMQTLDLLNKSGEFGKQMTPVARLQSYTILRQAADSDQAVILEQLFPAGFSDIGKQKPTDHQASVIIRALGLGRVGDLDGALAELKLMDGLPVVNKQFNILADIHKGSIHAVRGERLEALAAYKKAIAMAREAGASMDFDAVLIMLDSEDYLNSWPRQLNPKAADYLLKIQPEVKFEIKVNFQPTDNGGQEFNIEQNISADYTVSTG